MNFLIALVLLASPQLAHQQYQAGELVEDPIEAAQYFNTSLELYHEMVAHDPSPKALANIGNCYFQLGQYPMALLYYERARTFAPRDKTIKQSLDTARTELELTRPSTPIVHYLLGGHLISMAERIVLCGVSGLLLAIFGSIALWTTSRKAYQAALACGVVSMLALGSVATLEYLSTSRALLVSSATVRVDAGTQYAPVVSKPLPSGTPVTVKSVANDWVEIAAADGARGYIPAHALRSI